MPDANLIVKRGRVGFLVSPEIAAKTAVAKSTRRQDKVLLIADATSVWFRDDQSEF